VFRVVHGCEDDSQINSAHPNLGSEENSALLFDSSESRTEQSATAAYPKLPIAQQWCSSRVAL
jgi:hypothetical protein